MARSKSQNFSAAAIVPDDSGGWLTFQFPDFRFSFLYQDARKLVEKVEAVAASTSDCILQVWLLPVYGL